MNTTEHAILKALRIHEIDYCLEYVNPLFLRSDHENYQRALSDSALKRAEKHVLEASSPENIKKLLIAKRSDGSFWIVDGQHHAVAAMKCNIESLLAFVFESSGIDQEKQVFNHIQISQGRPVSV